jgi:hypothetical protein
MSDLQVIEKTLEAAAARRRRERAFRGLWQGVFAGAVIWLITLAVYKLTPIPLWSLTAAAIAGALAIVAGLIVGGWHKNTVAETARWVDGRQHLQERLSTALELSKGPGSETWRELLVTDAASHVKSLDTRGLVKFRLPKISRWTLLVLALAAGLGFVPEYRSKAYVQKQADKKVIEDVGRNLVELTKRTLANRPPALEQTQKAMEAVNELGEKLSQKALTRTEALKDLAKLTDKLKDDMKEMSKDPAVKRMEQAARARGGENLPDAARLQKQIEDAQKQLGNPNATPDAMDKLSKDLNKLQDAAKAAADKNGSMSAEDKQKLSQSMQALAKQAQEMGLQMPNMDEAIQALAANKTDLFMKDLEQATQDLEKTRDMAKSLEQMQQQMEKIGKDLAEQLKNGQPEAAQASLEKMIQQLKSANLSKDQLDKMLSDVSKAIDPGSKYGKVGEHLKAAAGQLKQGQNAGASQSLAAASKELEDLMKQMQDGDALLAELKALNKASMCVGSCQGWGSCSKPGYNPNGGKPGSGVGTWANEDSGWGYDGQQTQRWDNTGVTRPDQAARGLADRGEPELNDALRPDKVKGQFSPGGPMPSITLKGVSIKGQSKVAYEESAVAAQADAQSALSQEKVPRAYQGAVRDYFDDLKK